MRFPPTRRLARQAAASIARAGAVVSYEEAIRITEDLLPGRPYSKSLLRGLLDEGVLVRAGRDVIVFAYQRLGDYLRASTLLNEGSPTIDEWIASLGKDDWRERGTVEALSALLPEFQDRELIDVCQDEDGLVTTDIINAFIESLAIRAPEACGPRTVEIVDRLAVSGEYADGVRGQLARLACVPNHPLNALYLHGRLITQEVAQRDRAWSVSLIGAHDPESEHPVHLLVEWAWPRNLAEREELSQDVALLALLTLAWCFSTTDRRVRDSATKAAVSVAERCPSALADVLRRFRGMNDPYIVERLCAVACGVALRAEDSVTAPLIASALEEMLQDAWPEHLMTRDYVRRVHDAALSCGQDGTSCKPPYGSAWPVEATAFGDLQTLADEPGAGYASIWYSLTGLLGDFGRYVLQPALDRIQNEQGEESRRLAVSAIFDRVLQLGWSAAVFQDLDRNLGRWRDESVERVGKKYQWIGFYETLGRILDNRDLEPDWGEERPKTYSHPEQLLIRDIDPTVLAREPLQEPPSAVPWFAECEPAWASRGISAYPSGSEALPDPIHVICASDEAQRRWLNLASNPRWQQLPPPEERTSSTPHQQIWMQLHAYLIPIGGATAMIDWAQGRDWYGRWMPDYAEVHGLLLGAHPIAPEWAASAGGTETHRSDAPPTPLMQCAAWYGGADSQLDASDAASTRGFVPALPLAQILGITHGLDFVWNREAEPALQDPSFRYGGPNSLMMRAELEDVLAQSGFTVFWTVLMNQELVGRDWWTEPEPDYQWVSASASYILSNGQVSLVDSRASLNRSGAGAVAELAWSPQDSKV